MLIRILPLLVLLSAQTLNTRSVFAQLRSSAEPAEIRGQLRYAQGGSPAPDVVIRVDQLVGGFVAEVRTDRLGKFRFSNLAPIQYQLIVRRPGYHEILREVNLIMTGSEYLQLQLQPNESAPKPKSPVGVGTHIYPPQHERNSSVARCSWPVVSRTKQMKQFATSSGPSPSIQSLSRLG